MKVNVTVTHRYQSSAERVFDAWLDAAIAGKWLFATPAGTMVRAEIDARVGGHFVFTDRRDGQDIEHVGNYLEIDRPRRLAFEFSVPKFSAGLTRVSIDIAPIERGCELKLTHDGVDPEYVTRTQSGWGMLLNRLRDVLGESA